MPIVFAAAVSHAPGITAWPEAAPAEQRDNLSAGFGRLAVDLRAAKVDAVVLLTSEHWVNFFLDHVGAFCVGRASAYSGPVEPFLQIERREVAGDPDLAARIVSAAYERGFEPSFSYELSFDHGTMLPLHKLHVNGTRVVPVFFNTLVDPQPSAARSYEFGAVIGDVLRGSGERIALIATGGMSHDPGELRHGLIDSSFDRRFIERMERGDAAGLRGYSRADFAAAGAGAFELLAWIALQGALRELAAGHRWCRWVQFRRRRSEAGVVLVGGKAAAWSVPLIVAVDGRFPPPK
jgi:aromatic ring-opening dioxygenase catalytic subunit (LigB family)